MTKLYQKSKLGFALALIGIYVTLLSLGDMFSDIIGIQKVITAPISIAFVILIYLWLKKNNLKKEYGLCKFYGNSKDYLFFIPLIVIASVNLWVRPTINYSFLEAIFFIISMLCVGFLEEIIFRGFLFKSILKDNLKFAIFISSVTFGMGHIINLLNGNFTVDVIMQILYATAGGFLFTIIFYKRKSLIPCIITHGVLNSLSAFYNNELGITMNIIISIVLIVISLGYSLFIIYKANKKTE